MNNQRNFKWFQIITILLLIGLVLPTGSATVFAQGSYPPSNSDNPTTLPKSSSNVPMIGSSHAGNETIKGNDNFTAITATTTSSIINGDFEQGQYVGWSEFSTHGWSLVIPSDYYYVPPPHSGSWVVWLGGDFNDTSIISQGNIEILGTPATLRLWYWIGSSDVCGWDYGYVKINSTIIYTWNLCSNNNTNGWVMLDLNLNAYNGQVITLSIEVDTNGSANSNLFIDDVSLIAPQAISGNAGINGATLWYMDSGPKNVIANGSGNYSLVVPYNWSGTVTPYKSGYQRTTKRIRTIQHKYVQVVQM